MISYFSEFTCFEKLLRASLQLQGVTSAAKADFFLPYRRAKALLHPGGASGLDFAQSVSASD
jgi:hypothetical protein